MADPITQGLYKGYSFLNGVADCATNGWIILIGDHGAPRESIKPISIIALYGLYVCHLRPSSFQERGRSRSPEVHLMGGILLL